MICKLCNNKGMVYVNNLRTYKNGQIKDLGYYDVCECRKKILQKKEKSVKITRYNLNNNYALQKRKGLCPQLQ